MNISYYKDYNSMSEKAMDLITQALHQKTDTLLCAATGNSPLKTYQLLAEVYEQQPILFEQLGILKLDEWGGIPMIEPQTCESFLQQHLLKPLQIAAGRYAGFHSNPTDPQSECNRMQTIITKQQPVDLCILGLGKNGHLGFNEPADFLQAHCHVAVLSEQTLQHSMVQTMQSKPAYGMTLGMRDILQAKKIILLVTGNGKKQVTEQLLKPEVSTWLPASLLWLHSEVECLVDQSVLKD
jgi:galactosamine-6-phosphate isomerase